MSVRRAPDPRYRDPWLAEVYVAGRRHRRRFATRTAAREWEASFTPRAQNGLEEALAEYLEHHVPRLRAPRHAITAGRALWPYIRGRTVEDVPEIARAIIRDTRQMSNASVNVRLGLLRRLCLLMEEWGWIDRAPRIKLLPTVARETFLSREQVEALARRMPRHGYMVRWLAWTGMRMTEAFRLMPEDVRVVSGRPVVDVVTLKQRSRRVRAVPVPDAVVELVERIPFQVRKDGLWKEWAPARDALGLRHVRIHDLRHSCASWMAAAGFSDREMAEILGHTDPRMTRRYAHLTESHMARRMAGL